jgi:NitT/TauT family transport system permease protein
MAMVRKGRPVAEPLGLGGEGLLPNLYDLAIFVLIAGVFVLIAHGAHEMTAPAARLASEPITLDPANLPEYALRTTLRMFAAIIVSWWPRSRPRAARPSW